MTHEMMLWLDDSQAKQGLVGVVKRAARYTGVFLALRCSEYLGPDVHWDKVIMVRDVHPMKGHKYCRWSDDFDGFMVMIRGSKTDQYNEGEKR